MWSACLWRTRRSLLPGELAAGAQRKDRPPPPSPRPPPPPSLCHHSGTSPTPRPSPAAAAPAAATARGSGAPRRRAGRTRRGSCWPETQGRPPRWDLFGQTIRRKEQLGGGCKQGGHVAAGGRPSAGGAAQLATERSPPPVAVHVPCPSASSPSLPPPPPPLSPPLRSCATGWPTSCLCPARRGRPRPTLVRPAAGGCACGGCACASPCALASDASRCVRCAPVRLL